MEAINRMIDQINNLVLTPLNNFMYSKLLIFLLILAGVYFTFVPVRYRFAALGMCVRFCGNAPRKKTVNVKYRLFRL